MSTCKDCIHYEVGCDYTPTDLDEDKTLEYCAKGMADQIPNIEELCDCFKNTADVVEVVRCRDCRHWKDTSCDTVIGEHWGECRKPLGDYRYCETAENDYCSYGERREDGT